MATRLQRVRAGFVTTGTSLAGLTAGSTHTHGSLIDNAPGGTSNWEGCDLVEISFASLGTGSARAAGANVAVWLGHGGPGATPSRAPDAVFWLASGTGTVPSTALEVQAPAGAFSLIILNNTGVTLPSDTSVTLTAIRTEGVQTAPFETTEVTP